MSDRMHIHRRICGRRSPRRPEPNTLAGIEGYVAAFHASRLTPEARQLRTRIMRQALQLPMLTADQVRQTRFDHNEVVMLDNNGAIFVPRFQFTDYGRVIDVVAQINRSFVVSRRPSVAMHWWLTSCDMLNGSRPIDVIGHVEDSLLEASAKDFRRKAPVV